MKSCVVSVVPEQPHLILLHIKLDYIPNILPQTGCYDINILLYSFS